MMQWSNRALVRLGALDKPIRGERWRPLIRWLYRWMAGHYDAAIDHLFSDYRRMTEQLVEQAGLAPAVRVLDLGCGTGMVTLPAAADADMVVGLDLSDAMLAKLQRKASTVPKPPPHLLQADVLHMPLAANSFDMVFTSFMLPHLTKTETQYLMSEVARVLTHGGRFAALSGLDAVTDVYPSATEWRAWLEKAGFQDITLREQANAYRMVSAHLA